MNALDLFRYGAIGGGGQRGLAAEARLALGEFPQRRVDLLLLESAKIGRKIKWSRGAGAFPARTAPPCGLAASRSPAAPVPAGATAPLLPGSLTPALPPALVRG